MKRSIRWFPVLGVVAGLCAVVLAVLIWGYSARAVPMAALPVDLEIERGTVGPALARSLQSQGFDVPAWTCLLSTSDPADDPTPVALLYCLMLLIHT